MWGDVKNVCVFTCRNMSEALRVKRTLASGGITGSVVNIDPLRTSRGCALGVEVMLQQCRAAERVLRGNDTPFGEILR